MAREERRGDWKRESVKGVSRAVSAGHIARATLLCGDPEVQTLQMSLAPEVLGT